MAATLRPGFDPAVARRRLDDLDIPLTSRADELSGGQQAQVGLALALGGASAGPPPRRAAGEPRSAGASRVPARPRRRGPGRWLDGAAVVARHHRHRAGVRPAARPRRRAVLLDLSIAGAIAEHSRGRRGRAGRDDAGDRAARSSASSRGRPASGSASSAATAPAAGRRRSRRSCSATWPRPRAPRPAAVPGGAGGMSLTWVRLTLRLSRFELFAFGGFVGAVHRRDGR